MEQTTTSLHKTKNGFFTVIWKVATQRMQTSRYFCRHCLQTKKINGSLLNHYQKFGTRWRPSMLFYSKWRRIFVRNRVGSILNLNIHHASLYMLSSCHTRSVVMKSNIVNHLKTKNQTSSQNTTSSWDMMRDRSLAANISIANTRICEKCLPKLDK